MSSSITDRRESEPPAVIHVRAVPENERMRRCLQSQGATITDLNKKLWKLSDQAALVRSYEGTIASQETTDKKLRAKIRELRGMVEALAGMVDKIKELTPECEEDDPPIEEPRRPEDMRARRGLEEGAS